MKSETFVAPKDIYDEWAGNYEVRALTGADALAIEEAIFKKLRKEGVTPNVDNYPFSFERKLGLARSITRDGKAFTVKDVTAMPIRLYKILIGLYQRLNEPSQDEANFLSAK